MQSFIFSEVNKASRLKDISKIRFYGAFASALGYIIHCGNKKNTPCVAVFARRAHRTLQSDAHFLATSISFHYSQGLSISLLRALIDAIWSTRVETSLSKAFLIRCVFCHRRRRRRIVSYKMVSSLVPSPVPLAPSPHKRFLLRSVARSSLSQNSPTAK